MQRALLVSATMALAISASAPATAQHPAASTATHPASTAHATAVDAHTDAARIEACTQATGAFIDSLDKGDFQAATGNFDEQMKAALGADKLGALWQSIGAKYGKLASRGTPQNMMVQGLAVVTLPLRFEKGDLGARLACGEDGKFAGFHLVPVPPAEPAASK